MRSGRPLYWQPCITALEVRSLQFGIAQTASPPRPEAREFKCGQKPAVEESWTSGLALRKDNNYLTTCEHGGPREAGAVVAFIGIVL